MSLKKEALRFPFFRLRHRQYFLFSSFWLLELLPLGASLSMLHFASTSFPSHYFYSLTFSAFFLILIYFFFFSYFIPVVFFSDFDVLWSWRVYSTMGGAFNVYIMYKCTVSRQLGYFPFYEFSIITVIMYNFSKIFSCHTTYIHCIGVMYRYSAPYRLIMNHWRGSPLDSIATRCLARTNWARTRAGQITDSARPSLDPIDPSNSDLRLGQNLHNTICNSFDLVILTSLGRA